MAKNLNCPIKRDREVTPIKKGRVTGLNHTLDNRTYYTPFAAMPVHQLPDLFSQIFIGVGHGR